MGASSELNGCEIAESRESLVDGATGEISPPAGGDICTSWGDTDEHRCICSIRGTKSEVMKRCLLTVSCVYITFYQIIFVRIGGQMTVIADEFLPDYVFKQSHSIRTVESKKAPRSVSAILEGAVGELWGSFVIVECQVKGTSELC